VWGERPAAQLSKFNRANYNASKQFLVTNLHWGIGAARGTIEFAKSKYDLQERKER
jgi:hypothetical protein